MSQQGRKIYLDPHERENERLLKLFNDASSDELSCESEEPEPCSDEDPYNDCDGDYGSDTNYIPNEDSGSSHVSDSEEERRGDKVMRLRKPKGTSQGISDEQVPPTESPITLKDLDVHVHVPASVESPGDLTAVSFLTTPQNAQDSVQSLVSYASDTTPPRSLESITLLQEIDWTDTDNSNQQPGTSLTTSDLPRTVQQRQRSPPITEEWQTSTAPIPEFDFDNTKVGPQFFVDANTSPIDIFNRFFPPSVIEQLVERTNMYGAKLCHVNRPHTRGSRKKTFKPTTIEEIKRFLGLCILQSHIETPNIRKLFTFTDPLYYHPMFTYSMSGRRFEQLLRCLCVYEGNAKGINKILGFTNQMIAIFQDLYKPHKELSLDESMLLFRGRLSFRQYIKTKKAKYGVKFYILTTSDGYILNFKIYQGKDTSYDMDTDTISTSKTEKLVMSLLRPYLYKGHEIYMDNYYNSVSLSGKLLSCRTHTTGTLRKDRKDNPKNVVSKVLKKDEHVWMRKGKVYVSAWKDKRIVTMITTQHHPRLIVARNRFGKYLKKPKEVTEYNKFMSGIDISDQMLSYYSTPKKTIRWYKKVFFHIFDMAIWNAYYTFRKHCNDKETMLGFRERIIRYYLGFGNLSCADIISSKKISNPRKSLPNSNQSNHQEGTSSQVANNHWPELIPKTENCKRNKVFLKCRLCTKNKIKKETSYRCKGCPSKAPLCPGCFEPWHSRAENID